MQMKLIGKAPVEAAPIVASPEKSLLELLQSPSLNFSGMLDTLLTAVPAQPVAERQVETAEAVPPSGADSRSEPAVMGAKPAPERQPETVARTERPERFAQGPAHEKTDAEAKTKTEVRSEQPEADTAEVVIEAKHAVMAAPSALPVLPVDGIMTVEPEAASAAPVTPVMTTETAPVAVAAEYQAAPGEEVEMPDFVAYTPDYETPMEAGAASPETAVAEAPVTPELPVPVAAPETAAEQPEVVVLGGKPTAFLDRMAFLRNGAGEGKALTAEAAKARFAELPRDARVTIQYTQTVETTPPASAVVADVKAAMPGDAGAAQAAATPAKPMSQTGTQPAPADLPFIGGEGMGKDGLLAMTKLTSRAGIAPAEAAVVTAEPAVRQLPSPVAGLPVSVAQAVDAGASTGNSGASSQQGAPNGQSNASSGMPRAVEGSGPAQGGSHAFSAELSKETATRSSRQIDTVERIAAMIKNSGARMKHSIQMHLTPAELGPVRIDMTVRDGRLNLSIQTETGDAKQVLAENAGGLKSALADAGIELGKLDVSTGDTGQSRRDFAQESLRDFTRGQSGSRDRRQPPRQTQQETPVLQARMSWAGAVDLVA